MATYTTKAGDMWDQIAHDQMGSVNYMDRLLNLNQEHRNTYIFPAGVVLKLPERETAINNTLPPWKREEASA